MFLLSLLRLYLALPTVVIQNPAAHISRLARLMAHITSIALIWQFHNPSLRICLSLDLKAAARIDHRSSRSPWAISRMWGN
jgi:hypothetical protein